MALSSDRLDFFREVYDAFNRREIDPHVEPLAVDERPDGRLAVTVRQIVRSRDGEVLSDGEVLHVYELRDGLIARMDVLVPGDSTV